MARGSAAEHSQVGTLLAESELRLSDAFGQARDDAVGAAAGVSSVATSAEPPVVAVDAPEVVDDAEALVTPRPSDEFKVE